MAIEEIKKEIEKVMDEKTSCLVCGEVNTDNMDSICNPCQDDGYFMDPIGTIHCTGNDESYDPASAYI